MAKKGTGIFAGVFILLGVIALTFLTLQAANLANFSAGNTYTVHARFDNIGALKKGAPVRSAGVSVGQVTSITLDKSTHQALVIMMIYQGVQFPSDSSAKVFTAGLLGEQYVGIEPGSGDKNIANGDLIKQTQSAIVLENLIGQMMSNKAADADSSEPSASGASVDHASAAASNSGGQR